MIFKHLEMTLPKYMIRTIGPDAKFGIVSSLNGLLIIFLVPLFSPLGYKKDQLFIIILGTAIVGIGPFAFLFGNSYWTCISFVIVFTFGEAIYSPRVYDISFKYATKRREATYLALASLPTSIGAIISGVLSGWLLQELCPEEGAQYPALMWSIIGFSTMSTPLLVFFFK